MQHRWAMKPNIISRIGYEKKKKSDRGYEIFGEILNFPSSPLPGIINDHSLIKHCNFSEISHIHTGVSYPDLHTIIRTHKYFTPRICLVLGQNPSGQTPPRQNPPKTSSNLLELFGHVLLKDDSCPFGKNQRKVGHKNRDHIFFSFSRREVDPVRIISYDFPENIEQSHLFLVLKTQNVVQYFGVWETTALNLVP